ncbi:osmotically inducible protein C [Streptomyces sulfonofaciens]|uniref:Osmotically inducible protein C n=1 Tax=Streptomyces sulfonofaciens TaxID=68272 RepID=A0A919L3F9_9ACTN|nr:OsmC family protein [Streptomyces sulfonofaciens]GHH83545.1 osmotically inducible protein C [Streptomyces sulfonofaciens]
MTDTDRALYTTTVASRGGPDRVEADGDADHRLLISAPPALESTDRGAWNPEQLYAAAVASCLHQALGVVASEVGADLTGSEVHAAVTLEHSGALRYHFTTRVSVALPRVDAARRPTLIGQALRSCPMAADIELDGTDRG